jgi:hypothetical protein
MPAKAGIQRLKALRKIEASLITGSSVFADDDREQS